MLVDPCFHQLTPDDPMPEADWLKRANQLINAGVTHLLIAPVHPAAPMFPERVQAMATAYQEMLDRRGLSLVIYSGQTLMLEEKVTPTAFDTEVLYADLNRRYLLVQAPENITLKALLERLFEPLRRNITPVLVNPEYLQNLDDEAIQELRDRGVRLMVSGNSLLNREKSKRLLRWLRSQWVAAIGSVAEDNGVTDYRRVLKWLDKHVGRSYRDDLLFNNKALLNGDPFIENYHLKTHRHFFKRS